ncbi:AsmA family protein [Leptospira wolffii]|uniref:AsmA family protein n=1 Tax=Leptospira wolffii TaxID=409998 RepID=UPI0010844E0B|nr:AsmA family protein [Leptospira wolffii]TGK61760.1 AsmA family protein [Leptospira wolffii]TGK70303.1 AsmA family protein [Leptospira wolffii]TGK74952.1 AsmA family protein [Leptospira wolffii]TGL30921.1 AsmA family protein [Leptospira wolffii]
MRSWDVIRDYLEEKKIRFLFLAGFALLLFFLIVYIPFVERKEVYKEFILNQLRISTGLDIRVTDSDLYMFPFPGIELNQIEIRKNDVLIAVSNKVDLDISWFGLIKRTIEIRDIYVEGGSLYVERRKDGSFNLQEYLKEGGEKDEKRSNVTVLVEDINSRIGFTASDFISVGLKNVEIDNFTLEYREENHDRNYKVYFQKSRGSVSFYGTDIEILFEGKIDDQPINLQFSGALQNFPVSWDRLEFNASLDVEDISLSLLRDLFFVFPVADFSKSKMSGRIEVSKEKGTVFKLKVRNQVRDLAYKGGNPFGNIRINTDFELDPFQKRIAFPYIDVNWEGVAKASAKGSVNWKNRSLGQFDIKSEYGDYHNILKVARLFQVREDLFDPNSPPGIFYFTGQLNNFFAFKHRFSYVEFEAKYVDPLITVPSFHAYIYNGEILGKAKIYPFIPKIEVEGDAHRLQVDRVLLPYFSERIIIGEMSSWFSFETSIKDRRQDSMTELLANMKGIGNVTVKNGELMGYANFMIPVINTVGKIIALKGVDGSKFQFSTLKSDIKISGNKMHFPNMKLDIANSGMDVDGKGTVGFDKKIDMRIHLRIGGKYIGKGFYIPIIYAGTFGKGIPYVDPIWLGSVYTGMTVLGPYLIPLGGPYAGGVAGSVIGEYVRDLWDGVTNLFGGSSDEEAPKKQKEK